ncbi:MAG: lasso peptide biosynthesis B2 protein [Candidatus Binataceae bacterium]
MARRLAKFFRLSFSDQRLLMRAALAVVSAKVALRTLPLTAARAMVARLERLGWNAVPERADRIVWAVEAMGRAIPGMKNCLVQAIAAEAMLIRAGHPCEFRIGAAKTGPRELIAHAWLESEGKVLIGEFELDRYTPLVAPDLEGGARPARH